MNSKDLIQAFGFNVDQEQESIYPFSPVYKVDDFIIKRTQFPIKQANQFVRYLNHLHDHGVPVVTPVNLDGSNPLQIADECYVCYPFIDGSEYKGIKKEIKQAGKLLGKIHSLASRDNTYELEEYDVFDFYGNEVDEHIAEIEKLNSQYESGLNIDRLKEIFSEAVTKQDYLKNAPITWVETPHDYKANNLVYKENPVLIDPDHAKWIPRTFDLALALLLFHNEFSSAPNRLFTLEEWRVFLEGYHQYQSLTEAELKVWDEAVVHVFLDEVMWILAEEDDWAREEQRELLMSLVDFIFDFKVYSDVLNKSFV
ncbi:spectinomycin phosphotransferase [Alkalibacillus filiformis]|uniref:Spectinomycin phosphotransferase n=1 Tax=Alkalibacillus filiformis TaxID=200990 RepID=A0ABU0DPD3_9BACI|nr:phosphotransferase [Alkalibacillus filiformis]MDQ0350312.1 spectinomycin phosphotransferase [Alkalibacillus filiformis]